MAARVFSRLLLFLIFATFLKLRVDYFSTPSTHGDSKYPATRLQDASHTSWTGISSSFSSWVTVRATLTRPSRRGHSSSAEPVVCRQTSVRDLTSHARRHHIIWCLLLAGDVSSNPGPQRPVCACCTKRVRDNQAALLCDSCEGWFHRGCVHLSLSEYRRLGSSSDQWLCLVCSLPQFADDIFEVSTPNRPNKPVYPGASSPDTSLSRRTTGINKTATFWYNNCRSVKNKIPDLQTLASSLPHCSTILLSETWLNASVAYSELLSLDAYTVFRRDRNGRGGGVLMAIPSSFRVNRRRDLEHKDLEALFVEFFLPRGTILVCCVYCPPSSREKAYRLLDSSLEAAASKPYVNTLIFGDFNCHVDWCSHEVPVPRDNTDDVLLETTTAAGLVQVCQQPSYTSREGVPSFLDLVFTSDATRIELVETSEGLHGSDHLAVELRYAVSLPRRYPSELTGFFWCILPSAGQAKRMCRIMRSEMWKQVGWSRGCLRMWCHQSSTDERSAERAFVEHLQLALQVKVFLWESLKVTLPKKKKACAPAPCPVFFLGDAPALRNVTQMLEGGPKYSLQPNPNRIEKLCIARVPAKRAGSEE
ncbi:hypothetical protein ISCGN_013983 [Ixodes scapularis]